MTASPSPSSRRASRRHSTAVISRRYSAEARTSSIGRMCSRASAARRSPTSFGSDRGPTPASAGTSAGRTAHEPIATRSVPATGSQAAAEFTIARSCPYERLILSNALVSPAGRLRHDHRRHQLAGGERGLLDAQEEVRERRLARPLRARDPQPSVQHQQRRGGVHAGRGVREVPGDGGPPADLQRADRLRALRERGEGLADAPSSATSCTRTQAPISSSPAGVQVILPSSGMRLMSTSTSGRGPPRSAIIRSVPPARILAPAGPASSAVASATVPGLS